MTRERERKKKSRTDVETNALIPHPGIVFRILMKSLCDYVVSKEPYDLIGI